ncbi:E3 ubiquitin-protein ligase SIRP1 [Oryza brachyantha]|uniref:E3 ubiquitin-protein ligase SIRP1 n=1 Tax=Oryza brachyantha TaxID=4533 RepID=UPI000776ACA4|nr:E3 ubiquitin-protein ligase SIRP1 [Oryza brachyantha]
MPIYYFPGIYYYSSPLFDEQRNLIHDQLAINGDVYNIIMLRSNQPVAPPPRDGDVRPNQQAPPLAREDDITQNQHAPPSTDDGMFSSMDMTESIVVSSEEDASLGESSEDEEEMDFSEYEDEDEEIDVLAPAPQISSEAAASYRQAGLFPTSSKAIQGLREVSAADAKKDECATCLQDFLADDELRMMPCSHTFHQRCIFDWIRLNCICPLCRHKLPTQHEDDMRENP